MSRKITREVSAIEQQIAQINRRIEKNDACGGTILDPKEVEDLNTLLDDLADELAFTRDHEERAKKPPEGT